MTRAGVWLVVAASFVASNLIVAADDDKVDYNNPVRTAEQDEIKSLPNLAFQPKFKQYSGYLEADEANPRNKFFHYWLVESENDPDKDPLMLWLNGGPGCSSMEGILTESGPFRIHSNGSVLKNEFAWNAKINILYIEGPAGVGFSYGAHDHDYTTTDDMMAVQYLRALRSFLRKFPKMRLRPFYIVGESYGATYAAVLGWRVAKDAKDDINLKGIAMANGYTEADLVVKSLFFYAYFHGFLGDTAWSNFSSSCCDGKTPSAADCMRPEETDIEKCSKTTKALGDIVLATGINAYNVFDDCHDIKDPLSSKRRSLTRMDVDRQLLMDSMTGDDNYCSFGGGSQRVNKVPEDTCDESNYIRTPSEKISPESDQNDDSMLGKYGSKEIPCWDAGPLEDYLHDMDVIKALHIPVVLAPFVTCAPKESVNYIKTYPCQPERLTNIIKTMLNFGGNQDILIYYGDADIMCPFLSGKWLVDRFKFGLTREWTPWYVNKQVAGWYEQWHPITLATVKGAGHMVPQDKPEQAKHLIESWIYGPMNQRSSQL